MTDALACEAQTREFRTLSLAKRKTPRGHLVAHSLEQGSGKGVVALPTVTPGCSFLYKLWLVEWLQTL